MKKMFCSFVFCYLCFWRLVVFADADAVKTVSVMEGDSVSLESGVTQIPERDLIRWWFEPLKTKIAEIDKEKGIFKTSDVPDGRFRGRLKLDHQTGSLNITNIRTTDSGEYKVTISSGGTTIRFNVTVYVFAGSDAVKTESVSVKEGDSVTLNSSLTKIQTDDVISWMFGPQGTNIASVRGPVSFLTCDDVLDGRFRGRLKLDHQTGSLNITNTRTTDSGEYNVFIKGKTTDTKYRFNVTVYVSPEGHATCCDSVEAVLRLVATALMGVASAAAAVLLVNDVRAARRKTEKPEEI